MQALLESDLVTEATRQILIDRLNAPARQPTFFSSDEFMLLRAVCDRLIPQTDRSATGLIDIAGSIDQRLSENRSNGWRYDDMPPDPDAYRLGLRGVNETAIALFDQAFGQLAGEQQDAVLTAIQDRQAPGATWKTLPANRFFDELLAEAVEIYFSHPLAQHNIHYVGMTDAPGWQRLGLNELEEREK